MKPFNLEEYLKNPNQKVVTRDCRPARIICTDKLGAIPVVASFPHTDNNSELVFSYTTDGKICGSNREHYSDLMFAPEKKEGWVNVYKHSDFEHPSCACIYPTYEEAISQVEKQIGYVTTTKIEWEE